MSNSNDFIIHGSTLEEYVGPGGHVVIPEGVKKIADDAFISCSNLQSVIFSNQLTRIDDHAIRMILTLSSAGIDGILCVRRQRGNLLSNFHYR